MNRLVFLLLLSLPICAYELKYWPAPDCSALPQTKSSPYSNSSSRKVSSNNLTVLGINIPKNSMADIEKRLPKPKISNDNPGCASCRDYACYLSEDESSALIFYRYTAWDLNGFEILKVAGNNTPKHCISTNLKSSDMLTESGMA